MAQYVSSGESVLMPVINNNKVIEAGQIVTFSGFAGIALDSVKANETKEILIAFSGVWEVPYKKDDNDYYISPGMPALLNDDGLIFSYSSIDDSHVCIGLVVSKKDEAKGTVKVLLAH